MRARTRFAMLAVVVAAAWNTGCFVNEGEECAGNACSQDPGLHQRVDGNLVLTADGSVAVTMLRQGVEDEERRWLVGVRLPSGQVVTGPDVSPSEDVRLLLTPDAHQSYLLSEGQGIHSVRRIDLTTMRLGEAVPLEAGRFNGALVSPLGTWLATADAGAGGSLDTPIHLVRLTDDAAFDLPAGGLVYDVRVTRDDQILVALVHPAEVLAAEGEDFQASTFRLHVVDLGAEGPRVDSARTVEIADFQPNWLGYATWSIRLSPDGRWAAVSGYEKVGERQEVDAETGTEEKVDVLEVTTALVDVVAGQAFARVRSAGPVAFTPDSGTMVGFRYEPQGDQTRTLLVFTDLPSLEETVAEVPYLFPVYYITPAGDMVVTYGLLGSGQDDHVLITSLDTGASTASTGPAVHLNEFVVTPDGATIVAAYEGGLYRLGVYDAETVALRDATYGAENVNLLPDGDTMLVSREQGRALDLWSLAAEDVTRRVSLTSDAAR